MIIIVIFAVLVPSVFAKEFVVGDESGWTTNYDYQSWTKGKEFHVGDSLIFQYQPGTHSVLRVNLTEFHRCIVPADKKALTSGNDVFSLNSPGSKYYICTVGNDCSSFYQKLNITVLPAVESPRCSPSPNNTNSNTRSVAPCYSGWLVAMVGLLGMAMV